MAGITDTKNLTIRTAFRAVFAIKKNLGAGAAEVAPEKSGGFNGAY